MNRFCLLSSLVICLVTVRVADAQKAWQTSGLFAKGATVKLLAEKGAGEGPAYHPQIGLLTSGGHVWQYKNGDHSIYKEDLGTNGLLFDWEGRLVCCQPVKRRVIRFEKDGSLTVLTDKYQGKPYNQPNDLTIDRQGRIYFTDPKYGPRENLDLLDEKGVPVEGVYRIDAPGKVVRVISHEVDRPNGLIVTPDQRHMFIADNNNNTRGGSRKLWKFAIKPDGSLDLESRQMIFDWKNGRGPDGMTQDDKGRIYVAGGRNKAAPPYETTEHPAGIYVFSAKGKYLALVPIPHDETTNCAFGDKDLRTLYVTAGGHLHSVRTRRPGWLPFPRLEK
jgi:gluconolactonase